MGFYADCAIEDGFDEMLRELNPSIYDEYFDPEYETLEGGTKCGDSTFRAVKRTEKWDYVQIIKETENAWLLKMDTGGDMWFPKSRCTIDKKNHFVRVPQWLAKRKAVEVTEKKKSKEDNE